MSWEKFDDMPNKLMVALIFDNVVAGEKDLTLEEREDLCRALNAVASKWRARPVRPTGPDVSGHWIEISHATTAVQ